MKNNTYDDSSTYETNCINYLNLCKRLKKEEEKSAPIIHELLAKPRNEQTHCLKYSINSTLYRGSLFPSLIYDVVVGNTKRGRISSRKPKGKDYYIYYFDNNQLAFVEQIIDSQLASIEVIIPGKSGVVYGFNYTLGELSYVNECRYDDGKLVEHFHMFYDTSLDIEYYRLLSEQYTYENDKLHKVQMKEFDSAIINYSKLDYIFKYNEDGKATSYSAIDYNEKYAHPITLGSYAIPKPKQFN